jgi:GDPmannose 4,6-dehydratase
MTEDPSILVTGIGGQDGTLLARELSRRGCRATGVVAPWSRDSRIEALAKLPGIDLVDADLADVAACRQLVADFRPATVFHLAAISSVGQSWEHPVETAQVNGLATVALMTECLELARRDGRDVRFVNASSAEIFAGSPQVPQNEATALAPNSPYGAAKAFAHMMADVLRRRGLWVSNAVLYNHESPLRPTAFVTRKITRAAAMISAGRQQTLRLGNVDVRRDWGWAPDYVDCMIRMALHDEPDDFVVATGISHSILDFAEAAFLAAEIADWRDRIEVDPALVRPADSADLVGDASKAHAVLDWRPTKSFSEITAAMVAADLADVDAGANS